MLEATVEQLVDVIVKVDALCVKVDVTVDGVNVGHVLGAIEGQVVKATEEQVVDCTEVTVKIDTLCMGQVVDCIRVTVLILPEPEQVPVPDVTVLVEGEGHTLALEGH